MRPAAAAGCAVRLVRQLPGVLAVALAAGVPPPAPAAAATHALVIVGLGGEPQLTAAFEQQAQRLAAALEERHGVARERLTLLTERERGAAGRSDGRSTREGVERAFARLAERCGPEDVVLVALVGHGSRQGGEARFLLPGPDLTAADFARLARPVPGRELVFVNTASASGGFVPALSGPRRTVITATREGETNETRFAEHFVAALAGDAADADKDGRVSLLEAFDYARRETARAYEQQKHLLTEHALLDDDGDGVGSLAPAATAGDGARAARLVLAAADAAPADPALAALEAQERELRDRVAALQSRRESLAATDYERELEALLVELARVGQSLRRAREERP